MPTTMPFRRRSRPLWVAFGITLVVTVAARLWLADIASPQVISAAPPPETGMSDSTLLVERDSLALNRKLWRSHGPKRYRLAVQWHSPFETCAGLNDVTEGRVERAVRPGPRVLELISKKVAKGVASGEPATADMAAAIAADARHHEPRPELAAASRCRVAVGDLFHLAEGRLIGLSPDQIDPSVLDRILLAFGRHTERAERIRDLQRFYQMHVKVKVRYDRRIGYPLALTVTYEGHVEADEWMRARLIPVSDG